MWYFIVRSNTFLMFERAQYFKWLPLKIGKRSDSKFIIQKPNCDARHMVLFIRATQPAQNGVQIWFWPSVFSSSIHSFEYFQCLPTKNRLTIIRAHIFSYSYKFVVVHQTWTHGLRHIISRETEHTVSHTTTTAEQMNSTWFLLLLNHLNIFFFCLRWKAAFEFV